MTMFGHFDMLGRQIVSERSTINLEGKHLFLLNPVLKGSIKVKWNEYGRNLFIPHMCLVCR